MHGTAGAIRFASAHVPETRGGINGQTLRCDERHLAGHTGNVANQVETKSEASKSELGRQISVYLEADADFDECGSGPDHGSFP
jgi:hypothetical protein